MADTTEKTIADELREAAARAREHLLSHVTAEVLPQTAIVAVCGSVHGESAAACRNCVMFDVKDRVLARLVATLINAREPLADWLEKTAKDFSEQVIEDELECSNCDTSWPCGGHPRVLIHDDGCGGYIETGSSEDCRCFDRALAVARVLNGGVS